MKQMILRDIVTEFYTPNGEKQRSSLIFSTYQPKINTYYDYINFENNMIKFVRENLVLLENTITEV